MLKACVLAFMGMTIGLLPCGAAEKVSFKTTDGVTLNALFLKPAAGKPTVIMLHGLSSVKEEWNPLIEEFSKQGLGALAYDSRPAGTPWKKLVDDVGAALRFLEKTKSIDRKTIGLAGASLGANVCFKYGSLTNATSKILLMSPGLNYQGLTVLDAAKGLNQAKVLIIAHPADAYAHQSSMQLIREVADGEYWQGTKAGHGVQMFDAALLRKISQWFEN